MTTVRIDELNQGLSLTDAHEVATMVDGETKRVNLGLITDFILDQVRGAVSEDLDTLEEMAQAVADSVTKVGLVAYFPLTTPPVGWIKANGAALSRTTYSSLYGVIGTSYGSGDGSTTFNVPDLRGVFLRSLDDGANVDPSRAIGSLQGDAIRNITGTVAQMVSYYNAHASNDYTGSFYHISNVVNETDWNAAGGVGNDNSVKFGFDASRVVPTASENRPINRALLCCIKY